MGFESDFREINGRSPTSEETKRHLAFDRLAKTTDLDPATLLLIVDANRVTAASPARDVPKRVATIAAAVILICVISFAAAVAQYSADESRFALLAHGIQQPQSAWIMALATVASWPALPFVIALFVALLVIVALALSKAARPSRKAWP